MPKTKTVFEIEVETVLQVHAFNEDSARRKAAAALARSRALGDDVLTTGRGTTYAATRVAPNGGSRAGRSGRVAV